MVLRILIFFEHTARPAAAQETRTDGRAFTAWGALGLGGPGPDGGDSERRARRARGASTAVPGGALCAWRGFYGTECPERHRSGSEARTERGAGPPRAPGGWRSLRLSSRRKARRAGGARGASPAAGRSSSGPERIPRSSRRRGSDSETRPPRRQSTRSILCARASAAASGSAFRRNQRRAFRAEARDRTRRMMARGAGRPVPRVPAGPRTDQVPTAGNDGRHRPDDGPSHSRPASSGAVCILLAACSTGEHVRHGLECSIHPRVSRQLLHSILEVPGSAFKFQASRRLMVSPLVRK